MEWNGRMRGGEVFRVRGRGMSILCLDGRGEGF